MKKNKLKLGLGMLTVLATPIAVNTVAGTEVHAAQGWVQSGSSWYYYHQGQLVKNAWVGSYWLGADGKMVTNSWVDNGRYYVGTNGVWDKTVKKQVLLKSVENKVPTRGYENGVYYVDSKPANWWYDDGQAWYFFQNGKKLTGYGKDNAGTHYFVNGKYANGKIENKEYRDGKEISVENKVPTRGYANGVYYVDSKPANWWYDDGEAWYFFQNGKKLTGYGKDNAGTHYFVNGKYLTDKNTPALNMPQYYQGDWRWAHKRYGLGTMAQSGCVPTSLAMVFNGLGQKVLPTAVADTIYNNTNEMNVSGLGTSGKGAVYAINAYGYKHTVITTREQLIAALQSGKPVFATVGNGIFAKGRLTHAIILSGYSNGKTKAMDPDSSYNTGKWYDINTIWNQRSTDPYDTNIGGSFVAIG